MINPNPVDSQSYRFVLTTANRIVLAKGNTIICPAEEIIGYEHLKIRIVDSIVDNLSENLVASGVSVPKKDPITSPIVKNSEKIKMNINSISNTIFATAFLICWIMGVVVAKGFWSTIAAMFLPPYALYLVVELFMKLGNLIS